VFILLLETCSSGQVNGFKLCRKNQILAQRRREKQKQDLVALSCEKPFQASGYKGFLGFPAKPDKLLVFSVSLRLCAIHVFSLDFSSNHSLPLTIPV